jgi:hypothetical protein
LKEELHEEQNEENKIFARLDSEKAYRMATKRWGKRGRIFLDALRQGKDVSAASTAAGISRPTGYKYLAELGKLLSR